MDLVQDFRKRLNANGRTAVKGHRSPVPVQEIYDALMKVLHGEKGAAIQELSLRRIRATRPVMRDAEEVVVQILADYIQMEDAVITRNRAERLAQTVITPTMVEWLHRERDSLVKMRPSVS